MVTQSADLPAAESRTPGRLGTAPLATTLAFVGGVALVLLYALRGGGSYDIVVYEENGLVIWWLLAVGIALGLLPRARPSRGALILLLALLGFAIWTALSLIWSDSSELTFAEVARVLDYLGLVALVGSALDRKTSRPAAAGLGVGAFVVCVVAVGSRLAPSIFGHDQVDALFRINRLSVPFGYWNAVAAWGAMCSALGLAWSVHDTSRVRRAIALGLVPVAVLATYLTYSRAGVGGLVLGLILVIAISRHRTTAVIHAVVAAAGSGLAILAVRGAPQIADGTGTGSAATVVAALLLAAAACVVIAVLTGMGGVDRWRLPRRVARPLAIAAGVVLVAAAVTLGPHAARKAWHSFTATGRVQTSVNPNVDPTARLTSLSGNRYPLWRAALHGFDAHPLDGLGAGTYQFWWNEHATDSENVIDAHSIWIQDMEELGAPGLLLILAVAASAVGLGVAVRRRAARTPSAGPATAFLVVFLVYLFHASVDWMWESTAVTVLALAGIAAVGARICATKLHLNAPARIVLVLVSLGAGALQLPGILSNQAIRRSQAAERAGQGNLALGWAQNAVDAEPWSASAYQQLGLVRESVGQLSPAATDLQDAISREPQNYEHWLLLARIETERGQLDAAVSDYLRARQLRPLATVFAYGRKRLKRLRHHPAGAP